MRKHQMQGQSLNYLGREYLNAFTWVSHFDSPEFYSFGVPHVHPSRINAYNYCLQNHNTTTKFNNIFAQFAQ